MRRSIRLGGCAIGLIAVAVGAAQQPTSTAENPGAPPAAPKSSGPDAKTEIRLRRLESFTWNPVTQQLTWVLSTGDLSATGYSPTKQETYVIQMDAATMKYAGQDRKFDADEAEQVGKVMDLICRYALESTVWWENGGGTKPDQTPTPAPGTRSTPKSTPNKNENQKSRQVPPGMLRGAVPLPDAAPHQVAATRQ